MTKTAAQIVEMMPKSVHLTLEIHDLIAHFLVLTGEVLILMRSNVDTIFNLLCFPEDARAAVWSIQAWEILIATALAWDLAVAFDFPTLAFVAGRSISKPQRHESGFGRSTDHAIVM